MTSLLLALLACVGDEDPIDTEPPVDTGRVVEDPRVRARAVTDAYAAPSAAWRRAWLWKSNDSTDCPTAYEVGGGTWRIGGDCTDDDGVTWGGTLDLLEIAAGRKVTFAGWSRADAAGALVWDGEIVLPADDGLVATITERDADGALTRAWSKLRTRTWTALEIGADGGAAAWTVDGSMTVDDALYAVSASITEQGACASEPDAGTLAFTGFDDITFSFDGATACDGCAPFTDRAGASTLCPAP